MVEDIKSEFNMALSMLERINNILNYISIYSLNFDYPSWANGLFTLNREIRWILGETERKKGDEYFIDILNLLKEYNNGKKEVTANLFALLIDYDTFLREMLSDKDMLIYKKADVKKTVTNMG